MIKPRSVKPGVRPVVLKASLQGLRLAHETFQKDPTHDLSVQMTRSLFVSVAALIVDFGVLVLLKEAFGVHYLIAATLSFCLGVAVNYYLSVKWVFASRKIASRHAEFSIFFIICAIGLVLNLAIIAGMVQQVGLDYKLAKGVSTIVVFFWNFIARKKILY